VAVTGGFGAWLKQRRSELDLTQDELAERVGCSAVTIRKIEAGERRPSKQIAALLAVELRIPADENKAFARFARGEALTSPSSTSAPWRVRRPHNLPTPLTRLIDRERELAEVTRFFREGARRLVTVTGAPGIGKTRFSVQAAAELLPGFTDGAFLVPLAPVSDPELVLTTIAQTVGVRDAGARPAREYLPASLRDKHMLLLLDNFEQVTAAGSYVAGLLADCPAVSALVTSREPLNVRGEQLYPLSPLALPDLVRLPDPATLAQYPAIALFVERAISVNPGFVLAEGDGAVVTAICAHVDGLPLAIELIAANCRHLTPTDLLARLAGGYGETLLRLLSGGPQDLPARHRTLRSAIQWSFDMLGAAEKVLFGQCGIFASGFTLAAAQAVCATPDGGAAHVSITPDRVAAVLDALARKSLLQAHIAEGASRYAMLETIREFALERLAAQPSAEDAPRRHAAFYLALAEEAAGQLQGASQQQWLARLDQEYNNLRAALAWSLGRQGDGSHLPHALEPETGARLATALWRYWYMRGDRTEGRDWLELAVARLPERGMIRARLMAAAGNISYLLNDYERAQRWHEASLDLYRKLGPDGLRGQAHSLNTLGMIAFMQDDYDRAVRMHTAGLEVEERLEHPAGVAAALANLGRAYAIQGTYAFARDLFERSLVIYRELGDQHSQANVMNNLGSTLLGLGDVDGAARAYGDSLALFRLLGADDATAGPLLNLGDVARFRGDLNAAEALYRQSRDVALEVGNQWSAAGATRCLADVACLRRNWPGARAAYRSVLHDVLAWDDRWELSRVLIGLASVSAGEAHWRRAAKLFGAGVALRQAIRAAPSLRYQREEAANLAAVHGHLNPAEFDAAWAEGQSLSPEQAVAYAATGDGPNVSGV
jgi:predicted ATPase/DNA-binding XRE family transcriptional regulator